MSDKLLPPTGPAVLGETTQNLIANFRKGTSPSVRFPSTFRLARLVTGELGVLHVVKL